MKILTVNGDLSGGYLAERFHCLKMTWR